MFLLIDNYDSFVHNLARYFARAGVETRVVRNDALKLEDIKDLSPGAIILSPGPCTPKEAGLCVDLVKQYGPTIPMLGVCLGHQAIIEAYGGHTVRALVPMHGKASQITHQNTPLFDGLPNPLRVGRYHSLVGELPDDAPLKVTASTHEGIVMAVEHYEHPVYGVQFHPESILTEGGQTLIENFIQIVRQTQKKAA